MVECLDNRGFEVIQFSLPDPKGYLASDFIIRHRFVPLLRFLAHHRKEYRDVIWVDAATKSFNKTRAWLRRKYPPDIPHLIAARECWLIKDETQFNDPWVKATTPKDYDWLHQQEVMCAGTIAGDAETMFRVLSQMYEMVYNTQNATDQAAWNYIVHKPFQHPVPTNIYIPAMSQGWTATCSAFKTPSFSSIIGRDEFVLTDKAPVFDKERGLVLTPDGMTPYAMVHQYNRDGVWAQLLHEKYRWDA